MFTQRNQLKSVVRLRAVFAFLAACLVVVLPAIAGDTVAEEKFLPRTIKELDLCTLAYQLYHQSLCLPLDPWYDIVSRVGSDRRTNTCRFTHDYAATLGKQSGSYYSGPAGARNWQDSNLNLDPILTNYKRIDATLPAFTRDGERLVALAAPPYVTRNIRMIDGVRYKAKPTVFPCDDIEQFQIRRYPAGEDHLIVFEGGTGIAGNSYPAWSLTGFVLMQKTATGYDAHIVFRGSRSGSALSKTVWRAQDVVGDAKGNPDWITDLRGVKQIEQPLISRIGKVTEGFAEALPTMLGPISACCKFLAQEYPAPEHIYVTGHSLGAGLASQFVSAVLQGSYGDELRRSAKAWPWDKTTLIAFAQPIPGDPSWATSFDKASPTSEHYWVEGDSVVEATSNRIVGLFIDKGEHSGSQNKLGEIADCKDNPHEVYVIRAALLKKLATVNAALSQQLGRENTWAYYDCFSKMLTGQCSSYVYPGAPTPKIVTEESLRKILQSGNFESEFDNWLEQVYAKMIADKSSYIGFKLQSTLDERRDLVHKIVQWMRKPPLANSALELDSLVNEYQMVEGNLGIDEEERWIDCGLILSRFQKTNLTMQELLSKKELKNCLDSY